MNRFDAQISGHPWDSYEGLVESGMDPRIFGSCSMPSAENAGCAFFKVCVLRRQKKNLRQQVNEQGERVTRETPICVAYGKVMQDTGIGNVCISSCWNFHRSGSARERLHPEEGVFIKVLGYEGDVVMVRSRIKLHRKPEPASCEGCRNHACTLHEEKERPVTVPKFECYSDTAHAGQGERLKRQMLDEASDLDKERLEDAMARFTVEHKKSESPVP